MSRPTPVRPRSAILDRPSHPGSAWLAARAGALSLLVVRALGLKRAGRKLAHLDHELRTDSAIGSELARLEDPFREDT